MKTSNLNLWTVLYIVVTGCFYRSIADDLLKITKSLFSQGMFFFGAIFLNIKIVSKGWICLSSLCQICKFCMDGLLAKPVNGQLYLLPPKIVHFAAAWIWVCQTFEYKAWICIDWNILAWCLVSYRCLTIFILTTDILGGNRLSY